jgi:hypothetical protein
MTTIKKKELSIWDKPLGKKTLKVKELLIKKGVNENDIDIDFDDEGKLFQFFVSVGKKPYHFVRPFSSVSYKTDANMTKIVSSVVSWYKKAPKIVN